MTRVQAISVPDPANAAAHWAGLCVILLAVLIGIGPIWLVPFDMWDGAAAAYAIEAGDFSGMRVWLLDSNWWLLYSAYRFIAYLDQQLGLPWLLSAKAIATLGVLGMALETRLLARDVFALGRMPSYLAGAMVAVLPFGYMLYDSVHMVVFFVYLALVGSRKLHGRSAADKVLGWVCIAASFQLNSNLAFVLALEAARWCVRDRTKPWPWGQVAMLVGVAFAYYGFSRLVSAPSGYYAGYNNLLNPLAQGVAKRLVGAAAMFGTWLIFPAFVAICGALASLRPLTRVLRASESLGVIPKRDVWFALVVLGLGASLPYILLGKGPALFYPAAMADGYAFSGVASVRSDSWLVLTFDHWISRHAFVVVVPVAISCALLAQAIARPLQAAVLFLAIVHAVAWDLAGHSAKLSRAANEAMLVQSLRQMTPPPDGAWVDVVVSPNLPYLYSTLESNYVLWRTWGRAQYASALYFQAGGTRRLVQLGRQGIVDSLHGSAAFAAANVMGRAQLTDCQLVYTITLAKFGLWDDILYLTGLADRAAAPVRLDEQACRGAAP